MIIQKLIRNTPTKILFFIFQLFLHGFLTAGTVSSVKSTSWTKDVLETPRVSTGIGLAFIFKNLIRFELNYVLPIRYVPGDQLVTGIQFGAGLNFL